jgi:hypothetical protein
MFSFENFLEIINQVEMNTKKIESLEEKNVSLE